MPSVLTKKQVKTYGPRPVTGWGKNALIRAEVRYDDECGNGHNSFAITGEIYIPGKRDCEAGGCLHDEIAKYFPELAPYIKWHLMSSDGPMHYIANTVYHASNRDFNGLLKGETRQIRNGKTGLPVWKLADIDLPKYVDSAENPTQTVTLTYVPWNRVGEGKERDLDAARASAIWPEATDEELMADDLAEKLAARLPKLLEDFQKDIESLGFVF